MGHPLVTFGNVPRNSHITSICSVARHANLTPRRLTLDTSPFINSAQPPPMAGSERFSIAPMYHRSLKRDLFFRSFVRLLTKKTWVYTEMIVDQTLIHNADSDRFLWYPEHQHPIACQLGGSHPESLAKAAEIVNRYHYDEINLNCGCPSDRVAGAGCFGAALMLRPEHVASCAHSIAEAIDSTVAVTIKCRLGVDDVDTYEDVSRFVRAVSEGSTVRHFIIHARKCHLNGLNPHQNRTIPPLKYDWVFALKRDFPHLEFSLNGGVLTENEIFDILQRRVDNTWKVRSVMVGRAACDRPWDVMSNIDRRIFHEDHNPAANRRQVLRDYAMVCEKIVEKWKPDGRKEPSLRAMLKPVLNLFHGEKNGRRWKTLLDQEIKECSTLTELFEKTIGILPVDVLDRPPGIDRFKTGQPPPIDL